MKRLISLLAVCITVGMMPLFLVLAGIIDGAICTDFFEQIIPLTMETKRMLSSGMPLWSWNSFLGDNFLGANNFYVLGTPFTLICCLFPYEYIWIGLILCLYLQFILYGVSAMYYFRRMNFEDPLARIGAVMYSMSSFCIMAAFYFNFAIGCILFPIFLICIENLIDRRRYSFVALAAIVAAMVISNFYFAALSMLGGGMYFVCRILLNKDKRCLRTFSLFFGAVVLGLALSAVLFIPTILCTMGSGRNAVGNPFYGIVTTIIFDSVKLLYFFLPRLTEGFETAIYAPYANFSFYLPCVGYAFVICYCIKNLKSWLTCLIVLCIVILLSPLNIIFSLGANASYGRWGYVLILFAILSTLYCIRNKQFTSKDIRKYVLYASIYVFAMVTFKLTKITDLKSIIAVLLEVGLYIVGAIWLIVIAKSKNPEKSIYHGAICIGTLNMLLYTSLLVFSFHTDGVNNKLSRQDADSEFVYRTDIVSPERNSTYTANRPATETFHSVFNKNLKDFGICFRGDNDAHFFVTHHRESFDALTSVKEVIIFNSDSVPYQMGPIVEVENDYTIFSNPNYIPMGFAYDSYITESNFQKAIGEINYELPQENKDVCLAMLQHLVITDADSAEFNKYLSRVEAIDFSAPLDSVAAVRRNCTVQNFHGDTRGFKADVDNKGQARVFFFSTPADPGFTALLDGNKKLKIYRANLGMAAVIIPSGKHTLEFRYFTPGLEVGSYISLSALLLLCLLIFFIEYRKNKIKNAVE